MKLSPFMQKLPIVVKVLTLLVLCLVALIPLKSYLHPGIPYTHDGENHLARFANYKLAIKEGQFPPRFAPNLMNRYGYPVFNYNYPLPSMMAVPLSVVGFSYIAVFKILVAAAVVLGSVGVWNFARQAMASPVASLMGAVVYLVSPYLFGAIIYRGSIGEVLAMAIFPWVWWWIQKKPTHSRWYQLQGAGIWAAFFLAHNVGVLIGVPILLVLASVEYGRSWQRWLRFGTAFGLGICLTLWFWLPAMAEKSLIVLDNAGLSTLIADQLPTVSQLLFAPQQFGFSLPGEIDTLSFSLGLLQIVVACILTLWLIKNRDSVGTKSAVLTGGLIVVWGLVLLQTSISLSVWQTVPLLRFVQFPWRLTMYWSVLIGGMLAMTWDEVSRGVKLAIFVLLLCQAGYFWHRSPVDYRYLTDQDYEAFTQSTTTSNENLPKGFTYLEIGDWQPTARLIEGQGTIQVEKWRGSDRQYQAEISSPALVVEPTMAFAGWRTTIITDDTRYSATYIESDVIAGRIAYQLPVGTYLVRTQFTQRTPARLIGNTVSLVTLLGMGVWIALVLKGKTTQA